jgi:hypothetical protein
MRLCCDNGNINSSTPTASGTGKLRSQYRTEEIMLTPTWIQREVASVLWQSENVVTCWGDGRYEERSFVCWHFNVQHHVVST